MPGGGPHGEDGELFGDERLAVLRSGAADLRLLRERGYALDGALKLVGDRYQLRERQRRAIARATSEAATASARAGRRVPDGAPAPPALWIDGLNVVITLETALRGGLLVTTVDAGGLRDLAGVHGSYRPGGVTDDAVRRLLARLAARGWGRVPTTWYLDAPVSNTGRLAERLRAAAGDRPWAVEVVPDADRALALAPPGVVVASGDAPVLDRAAEWVDLGAEAVRGHVPGAWVVDLQLAGASQSETK